MAIYFASVKDKVTVVYYFDGWDISPPKRKNEYLLIDIYFKSKYLISSSTKFHLKIISNSKVLAKYQNIWITSL